MPPKKKAPAPPINGMKQGNLFSFFTKKPKEAVSSSVSSSNRDVPASATKTASTASTSKSTPQSTRAAPGQPRTINSAAKVNKVKIGMKIAVFWPDDKKYYPAVVAKQREDRSKFYLEYEDDECEWIDLRQEKFRFIEDEDVMEEEEEEEDKTDETDERVTQPKKKRPRIQEDSDEEEFEMGDSLSSDGTEGSAYDDDEAALEEEQDHDQDQWLVSDDEDDEAVSGKRKAPGKKKLKTKAVKVTKHTPAEPSNGPVPATQSASKTPKSAAKPNSSATSTVTPKSLANFSAFSTSQSNTPKRVTPSSSSRSASAPSLVDAETAEGTKALPYVQNEVNPAGSHVHHHLKFIQNPHDEKGRTKDHPEYNPRTLKVDQNELKKHNNGKPWSAGVEQWWKIKSAYFDTVLLFKTGKFYEMYHMDADIGVNVCGLQYMKGHVAHAGFPESSYGIMADKLCRAGYPVARVEQTETPDMLKERKKKSRGPGGPKVVNREVCSVMTMGTRTYCYLDKELESDGGDAPAESGPLLAIREVLLEANASEDNDEDAMRPVCEYGIVVVDAARAEITIGQFADDVLRTRMTTLLAAFAPSEILVEGGRDGASQTLRSLLRTSQTTSPHPFRLEQILPIEVMPKSTAIDANIRRKLDRNNGRVQPWDVQETLQELNRRRYFPRASRQETDSLNTSRWPAVLRAAIEGNAELALSSLGAALFYLQRNLIDEEILSMGIVKAYIPPVSATAPEDRKLSQFDNTGEDVEADPAVPATNQGSPNRSLGFEGGAVAHEEDNITHMSIDGNTLCQLEILTNSIDHKVDGSLWSKIKFTKTPHGTRLLRAWLLRPLFRKADIDRRADAVEELVSGDAAMAMGEASTALAKCGDIERLLAKIHSMGGVKFPGAEEDNDFLDSHPNSRAILYETKTHTKRKVGDFSKVLHGLRSASKIPEFFAHVDIQSGLLAKIVRLSKDGGCFPDISDDLDWFFSIFDFEKAANGEFEPGRGVDVEFDEACDAIEQIHSDLESYKEEMMNTLQPRGLAKSWKYTNTGQDSKDKFTIELPNSVKVPKEFRMVGKRGSGAKQVNKYRTAVVEELVISLERAIEIQKERKARQMQLIFGKFDAQRTMWAAVAQATALLDALGSLAQLGSKPGYCRPKILDCPPHQNPCIRVEQGRHPCVETTPSSGEFIPNDLSLGGSSEGGQSEMVLLLSGPNMGGKSTLLRQTCLISILAQIGSFVPAASCELTPIDKCFTRLGASDRILLGQSTFFVELAETAAALRGATRRSLILMDELGRGTSSFDGTAIASACLSYICSNLKCLSLFATHYHSLLEEFGSNNNSNNSAETKVRLGHMESVVNDDQEGDQNITFLYTLGDGACPKSFGVNVARLAKLPEEVLKKAKRISTEFENEMNGKRFHSGIVPDRAVEQKLQLAELIGQGKLEDVENIWEELQQK